MPKSEFLVVENYEALSRVAASRFAELAGKCIESRGQFSAALSGGSTPKGFLQSLSMPEFAGRIDWQRVQLFQVDERPVPPNNADSNYGMIKHVLLNLVPDAARNFHRMRAEHSDLDAAAHEYENEISRTLQPHAHDKDMPRLDVIFLGLGPDGHTASLFPHSPGLAEQKRWVIPNFIAKLKLSRLTLTFPVLNAAREAIFLVSGPGKAEILETVLYGARDIDQFPSQGIDPVEGRIIWYLDKAAAAKLRQA